MQITLNQSELDEAIEDYVRSQININDDQDITIDLKATRGAEGNTATIDIRKAGAKPVKPAKPAYRGNKPGPKPKAAKPEPEDEPETTVEDEAPEAEAAEGTSILGNHDGNLDDDLYDKLEEDVAKQEATSPEADPDTEAFVKFVSEDNDADEAEAEPEKAAEEKPARTPGSIFSRAG